MKFNSGAQWLLFTARDAPTVVGHKKGHGSRKKYISVGQIAYLVANRKIPQQKLGRNFLKRVSAIERGI